MKSAEITYEMLVSARNGETEALDIVAAEMMRIAVVVASKYARGSERINSELFADYESAALESMWEAVKGLDDSTVIRTTVSKFLYGAAQNGRHGVRAEVGTQTAPGAERHAMDTFLAMLKLADGDIYKAEKMCQTEPPARQRLSAENAYATRMAYQGTVALEHPAPTGRTFSDLSPRIYLSGEHRVDIPADLLTAEDLNSIDRQRRVEAVREALTHLSEFRRNVIMARFGFPGFPKDMENADVADLLGVTPKSCKEAYSNGLSQMRKLLDVNDLYGRSNTVKYVEAA
ncbi:hypothetical protein [Streptomyces malaysiensis]